MTAQSCSDLSFPEECWGFRPAECRSISQELMRVTRQTSRRETESPAELSRWPNVRDAVQVDQQLSSAVLAPPPPQKRLLSRLGADVCPAFRHYRSWSTYGEQYRRQCTVLARMSGAEMSPVVLQLPSKALCAADDPLKVQCVSVSMADKNVPIGALWSRLRILSTNAENARKRQKEAVVSSEEKFYSQTVTQTVSRQPIEKQSQSVRVHDEWRRSKKISHRALLAKSANESKRGASRQAMLRFGSSDGGNQRGERLSSKPKTGELKPPGRLRHFPVRKSTGIETVKMYSCGQFETPSSQMYSENDPNLFLPKITAGLLKSLQEEEHIDDISRLKRDNPALFYAAFNTAQKTNYNRKSLLAKQSVVITEYNENNAQDS